MNDIFYSMIEKFIHSYVNRLTKDDIIQFASKNQVSLTNQEVDLIYMEIKNNWQTLLYNPNIVFERVKGEVSPNTYEKIIYFYDLYSKKLSLLANFH